MKHQVVDGEGVNMLYNRLRNKNTVCFLIISKTNLDLDIRTISSVTSQKGLPSLNKQSDIVRIL